MRGRILLLVVALVCVACMSGWFAGRSPSEAFAELTLKAHHKALPHTPSVAPNSDKEQENKNTSATQFKDNTPTKVELLTPKSTYVGGVDQSFPERSNTASQVAAKYVKPLIDQLSETIHADEIKRSKFTEVETPFGTRAMVVIPPPTAKQIAVARAELERLRETLPSNVKNYYSVDAQRLFDEFYGNTVSSRVVYFFHGQENPSSSRLDTRYWEFITQTPDLFSIGSDGARIGPAGVNMHASRGWFDGANKPNARYGHLFKLYCRASQTFILRRTES